VRSSVPTADLDGLRAALGSGVVLPYSLALAPAQPLTAGALTWPWEHAHRVLHRWRSWTHAVGDDVTSVARLVRAPHLAGVAPSLRGRAFVTVDVAIAGEPGIARLADLRRLEPEADTVALVSARELLSRQPPVEGTRAIGEHTLLRALPAPALDAFIAAAGPGSGSELVAAELRHLGGDQFAAVGLGVAADPEQAERVRIGLAQLARRLAPWADAPAA
jgi:hypothetical protein